VPGVDLRHPDYRRQGGLEELDHRYRLYRPVRAERGPEELPQGVPHRHRTSCSRGASHFAHTTQASTTSFKLETLDGGSNPQGASQAGIEANLDVQYTVGVATGVPVYFLSVGDNYQDGNLEGFLDTVNFVAAESPVTYVMTTSYGQNENTMSRALATKLCNAYASVGAQGVSVLFASGDGGVAGSQSASCTKFVPTFPAGCP
jgi:tripeptidyl-peptidase-1